MRFLGGTLTREESDAYIEEDGFRRVSLPEIVSMTAIGNLPSRRVMERLGMERSIEFDHPRHPETSPLRKHVLYRLRP
jgi:ribosomal-protein-alanine N-acetyltransferase